MTAGGTVINNSTDRRLTNKPGGLLCSIGQTIEDKIMKKTAHIKINDRTLCKLPTGRHFGCDCEYPSIAEARAAVKVLRPHYSKCKISVVTGDCPNYTEGAAA
jgi:hypothetical protein